MDKPKIKGKTQDEVDDFLDTWKSGPVKKAYRSQCRLTHPDRCGDESEQAFKDVQDAYDQIVEDLKVKLKRKPTPPPTNNATACPNGHARIPEAAKFCHECGHDYLMHPLEKRLRRRGITQTTLDHIKTDGTFNRLLSIDPFSKALENEVELLFQRQRLGLISPHAKWRGF